MKLSREQAEFLVVATREANRNNRPTAEGVTEDVHTLLRLARQHQNIAEKQCNESLTQADEMRERSIQAKIERVARVLFEGNILKIEFGGDPRGFTVKLHFKSGVYNSWGGKESGYGIPT